MPSFSRKFKGGPEKGSLCKHFSVLRNRRLFNHRKKSRICITGGNLSVEAMLTEYARMRAVHHLLTKQKPK